MSQPPSVRSSRFPYVPIHLELRQRVLDVEAHLDTGLDGHVVAPSHLLGTGHGQLQRPDSYVQWRLVDGSIVSAPVYAGRISIGQIGPYPVAVTILRDEVIIGVRVAARFTIPLVHGNQVIVEP
jgi:hypothetical protein